MKNVQQILKRRAGIMGMIGLLTLALSSCVKNHYDDNPQQPVAMISVINASPDSQPLDFYLEPNRANNAPIPYGDGLDYLYAYTGKRTATFSVNGTSTKIKTDTMTLKANGYYSLFLSNLVSKPDYILTRDTLLHPASGMAAIRFINLGADAPAVDFAIKGGAVLAANKAYKAYSSFSPIAGNTKYTIEIRQAGTATVLATLTDVTLQSASIYTVWLQGVTAATDAKKPTARIQQNAFFY